MSSNFFPPSNIDFKQTRVAKIRSVGFVAFPGIEIIDLTGPMEVFAFANTGLQKSGVCTEPAYRIDVLAATPGPITTSCGLQIIANKAYSDTQNPIDTLMIPGSPDVGCVLSDANLKNWVIQVAPQVDRLASVCTGAFMLAESGLLNGRRATTHWDYCTRLAQSYPSITVEPDRIFVRDGSISTSGGITSGIDLALSMVEEDWGSDLALLVARYLVMFLKRPGGQTQFSAYLTSNASRPEIKDLQAWIMLNLTEDLRVETLAERMCMSPRNFSRFFLSETGITPAKFVELARIDAARHYLGSTKLSIEAVSNKAGFASTEHMRRAFMRQLGINAQTYRDRFGMSDDYSNKAA